MPSGHCRPSRAKGRERGAGTWAGGIPCAETTQGPSSPRGRGFALDVAGFLRVRMDSATIYKGRVHAVMHASPTCQPCNGLNARVNQSDKCVAT